MTSGNKPVRCVLAVMALMVAAHSGLAATEAEQPVPHAWGLDQLMRDLGRVKEAKGLFVERKYIAMLNAPLESSGTLIYRAPGRLEKHTLRPRAESLTLEGDKLRIEIKAKNERRTFALPDNPVLWAFVESIRSTLAGDARTLNRFYHVALEGTESRWRLLLKPREQAMQDVVSEIRLGGSGTWIGTIETLESGGDRSVMTVTRDAS